MMIPNALTLIASSKPSAISSASQIEPTRRPGDSLNVTVDGHGELIKRIKRASRKVGSNGVEMFVGATCFQYGIGLWRPCMNLEICQIQ